MRAVLDTNVLLSGLLWHGAPHALFEQVRAGGLTLVMSPSLFIEFCGVARRAKFQAAMVRSGTSTDMLVRELHRLAEFVEPGRLPGPVSRDPDDDLVLAAAVTGQVDFIVSGDRDLLVLESYAGIPIVTPALALSRLQT